MAFILLLLLFLFFNFVIFVLGILTIIFGVIRFIKKKFKNTFISLLITTLILLVIDIIIVINFSFNFITNFDFNVIMPNYYEDKVKLVPNPLEQLFMSDEEKVNKISESIIEKITSKDPENIKKIFSEDLINNVNNLNDGINKLISIADEGIVDVKVIMNGSQTHFESGNHRKIYRFSLNITTTNNKVYYIRFNYDYENPFNTKTLGVNRMLIMDENNNIILLIENEI